MRDSQRACRFRTSLSVDTCGTGVTQQSFKFHGGDVRRCGAGAKIAKHGELVSSKSARLRLEALGVNINLAPDKVAQTIAKTGVGFMFAPNHHSAMKHAAPVRRELGVKTLFNILGPLTNPAGARQQLMGVFHPDLVGIQVRVLNGWAAAFDIVMPGRLYELSLSGRHVGELKAATSPSTHSRRTWVARGEARPGAWARSRIESDLLGAGKSGRCRARYRRAQRGREHLCRRPRAESSRRRESSARNARDGRCAE